MTDPLTLICAPVSRIPEPVAGAEVYWCGICAEEVWVSPASKAIAVADGDDFEVVCTACAPGLMEAEPGALMPTTPEQWREVRDWEKKRRESS